MGVPAVSSRLKISAPIGGALQAIAHQEFDSAEAQIAMLADDPILAVHQCRKTIKRLRAIVRIGISVPGAHPRPIDRRLRDAGRALAPLRDATVVAAALEGFSAERDSKKLKQLKKWSARRDSAKDPTRRVLRKLNKARSQLPVLFAEPESWTFTSLVTGIEASYVRAATEMYRFSRKNRDKIGHEWRKEVQCLFSQMRIIKPLSPEFLSAPLRGLAELSGLLGEHHDLAVLHAQLRQYHGGVSKKKCTKLRKSARARQDYLRRHALEIGFNLFAQEPDAFRTLLLTKCAGSSKPTIAVRKA